MKTTDEFCVVRHEGVATKRSRSKPVADPPASRPRSSLRWPRPRVTRKSIAGLAAVLLLLTAGAFAVSGGPSEETLAEGRELFVHEWQAGDALAGEGDGLGPVFNARSCAACHFQGGIGGGGPNEHNVLAYEVLPAGNRTETLSGVVHVSATRPEWQESAEEVKERYQPVPVPVPRGCSTITRPVDPVLLTSVNTPALFGLGLLDDVSGWTIRSGEVSRTVSQINREFQLEFDGTPVGRVRKLPGGAIGKFGWKAQFATLEDFVAAACAVELGLSNPHRKQPVPGEVHEDEEAELDIDRGQFRALVEFVRSLPRPERELPADPIERVRAERGEQLFASVGCADCHTPEMGGIDGLYSDLLLHRVTDPEAGSSYGPLVPERPSDGAPHPEEWKTPPLWGVADSAPYFHDGSAPTLEAAILRHAGEARRVTERFTTLNDGEQDAIVSFLKTLRAPRELREAATVPVSLTAN